MRKIYLVLTVFMTIMIMIGCSGEDNQNEDTTPPYPPVLVPHLGDTGDLPVTYNNQSITLNDENNGIDAVPDGDWIRLSWQPFLDTDLSHVKIYRYDEFNPEPAFIDSISSSSRQYLDSRTPLNMETVYSYFIDLVDFSGNYTRSDTVSYALLSKSQLITPANNEIVAPTQIEFLWNRSGFATKFRVLVFDENYEYVWHQDLVVSFEEDPLRIPFPVNLAQENSGKSLIWRVDSFDWNNELQMFIGSESNERMFHIQ